MSLKKELKAATPEEIAEALLALSKKKCPGILERESSVFMPTQGRSTAPRTEYIGYHGPWSDFGMSDALALFESDSA